MALQNAGISPEIPSQGSVGASGVLGPLAHLAAVLIGEGRARVAGQSMPARDALAKAGLAPLELEAKEGLALLNGTQVSTALALAGLFAAEANLEAALLVGAPLHRCGERPAIRLSTHASMPCAAIPARSKPRVSSARSSNALAEIRASHRDCPRVQDPYSIRCQPQVLGPCLEILAEAGRVLTIEANAATDNPAGIPRMADSAFRRQFPRRACRAQLP